jgi:hypothetical protein
VNWVHVAQEKWRDLFNAVTKLRVTQDASKLKGLSKVTSLSPHQGGSKRRKKERYTNLCVSFSGTLFSRDFCYKHAVLISPYSHTYMQNQFLIC